MTNHIPSATPTHAVYEIHVAVPDQLAVVLQDELAVEVRVEVMTARSTTFGGAGKEQALRSCLPLVRLHGYREHLFPARGFMFGAPQVIALL